jgi:hypothetical protein
MDSSKDEKINNKLEFNQRPSSLVINIPNEGSSSDGFSLSPITPISKSSPTRRKRPRSSTTPRHTMKDIKPAVKRDRKKSLQELFKVKEDQRVQHSDSESDDDEKKIIMLAQNDVNWINFGDFKFNIGALLTVIQLSLALVLVAFSLFKLITTDNEALVTVYTSLLCGILGFLLPNPSIK